jgi:hypothetical protein
MIFQVQTKVLRAFFKFEYRPFNLRNGAVDAKWDQLICKDPQLRARKICTCPAV